MRNLKTLQRASALPVYARGDGSDLNVFRTDFGEMGGLICGEHANSLAKFSLIARGEKIHVASTPAQKSAPVGRRLNSLIQTPKEAL